MEQNNQADFDDETLHLEQEHGLKKTVAYVLSEAKRKSNNAERQARHREEKRKLGLVQAYVPTYLAETIKTHGSYEQFMSGRMILPAKEAHQLRNAYRIVIEIRRLPAWKKFIIKWLMKWK